MHDMGEALNGVELLHLDRTEPADLPKIVPPQIHQHIVLRQLFLIGEQLCLQNLVLLQGLSPGPGTREREGVEHAVFQLDQSLRRRPRHLHICSGKIEHIGGGVKGAQHPVGVEQAALKGGRQAVGEDDLKNIPFPDVDLGLLHHSAEVLPAEQRRHRAQEPPGTVLLLCSGPQQLHKLSELQHRLVVAGLRLVQGHIDHENELLPQMVKGNDLVKEHQIKIPKFLAVLHLRPDGRLAVPQIVIGEVSHKPAGEGREMVKAGAFVLLQDLTQVSGWVRRWEVKASGPHLPVPAGDLKTGIKAQEGVASPGLMAGCGLQHIAVGGNLLQDAHGFYGRGEVRQDLTAHRQHPVSSGGSDLLDFLQCGNDLHGLHLQIKILLWRFCQRSKKSPLTETTVCQGRIKHIIRGATLIHGMTRALSGIPTYPRQMTSACNVAAYSVNLTFDCALSGPFDNLFLT